MKLISYSFLAVFFVFAFAFTGCNEEPTTSVSPDNNSLPKFVLPPGAVFNSASFNIYVNTPNGKTVDVHNVNVDWTEAETYNSFYAKPSPQFNPTPIASFTPTTADWYSVDVSSAVAAWINGTIPNYGFILNQVENTPNHILTIYDSKENVSGRAPFLEIQYTLNGQVYTVSESALADTYLQEVEPDDSKGSKPDLYTHHVTSLIKQTLIKFDVDPTPQFGCETAYAYDGLKGTCFNQLGFGNWGWSIGPLSAGSYTFPVYAGAGQCNINNGTLVGNVTVNYNGSQAIVNYNIDPAYTVEETHLYVGKTQVPKNKKGKNTVAPGQYPYRGLSNTINITGDIYVIAHAVVCGNL